MVFHLKSSNEDAPGIRGWYEYLADEKDDSLCPARMVLERDCISGMEGAGEGGVVEGVSLFIVAVPGCGRKTLSESQVGAVTFSISVLEYVRKKPFCGYPVCLSLVLRLIYLIARALDKNLDKKILQASCWSDFATSVWRLLVLQPIGCILLRVRTSKLEGRTQLHETSRTGFNWRFGPVIGSPQVSLPSESSGALTSLTHRGVEICVMIRVKKLR